MSSNFSLFKKQIDDAVGIIESTKLLESKHAKIMQKEGALVDTQSLLARCEQTVKKYKLEKPTIRIIHHLACSGGTLISKCLSALPNVYLLSEVHPHSSLAYGEGKLKYAPSDIALLSRYAGIPKQKELSKKLFKKSIDEVYQHVTNHGGTLVLRDHSHTDFSTKNPIVKKSTLIDLLEDSYNILLLVTVRNPLDSYASLVKNGWVHFEPKTFDEYCRRFLCFLEQFKPEIVLKYEDFVKSPISEMRTMTDILELPFDETFTDTFSIFNVTGDSGRTSSFISERQSIVPSKLIAESQQSEYFKKFLSLYPTETL